MSRGKGSVRFGLWLAVAAAVAYPLLLLFVVAWASSPLNGNSTWGIAAEHGELVAEQWSQFLAAVLAAAPLAIASRYAPRKVASIAILISSLATALPYVVQPTHQFSSNDGWLANFTWQVAAVGVALGPLLLAALIQVLLRVRRAVEQNVA
jgi:hypothetical protein